MIDLVLVNPPATAADRYGGLGAAGSRLPPIGLALLAAIARDAGFSVAIVDAECERLSPPALVDRLARLGPAVVGFTAVTMTVHSAAESARLVGEQLPGSITILGGVHVSSQPEGTYHAFPWFDALVLGEADETLPELLKAVRDKTPLTEVSGLMLRNPNGALLRTGNRPPLTDLDSLPMPAFDLLGDFAHRYRPAAHSFQRLPATSLISSRGCPGRCTFCDRSVSGSRVRTYSAEYLVNVVEHLKDEYGIREIVFHDDNFVAARTRLMEFCDLMLKRRIGISWSCTGRVDMVDAEALRAMRKSGCWRISYGIESGSQAILDSLCKGTTLEGIRKTLDITAKAGIQNHGYFMIGVPGETEATLRQTAAFLLELPLADFHMTIWSPHPGTELTRRIIREGWVDSPERWPQLNDWTPVYVPDGLTAARLLEVQREAFRQFYARPRIIGEYALRALRRPSVGLALLPAASAWVQMAVHNRHRT